MSSSHVRGAAALAVAIALAAPAAATAVNPKVRGPHAARDAAKPFFDSRSGSRAKAPGVSAKERSARAALRARLGRQAVVEVDRRTGTVRSLQRLDGALSAPAAGDRSAVALRWVRANRAALGLSAADVDALRLSYRAVTRRPGITHLRYRQAYRGIPAFDNGLRVNLDRGGRVLNVTGSPALRAARRLDRAEARRGGRAARAAARRRRRACARRRPQGRAGARRETRFGADLARLVLFTGAGRHAAGLARHLPGDLGRALRRGRRRDAAARSCTART